MFWIENKAHRLRNTLFVCLFLFLGLLVHVSEPVVHSQYNAFEQKRVLFISSYSPAFNTFYHQIDGIIDTFEGYPVTVDMEFIDSKRFHTEENYTNFYNTIAYKLSLVDYDLVLVSDDNGLNFVMEYQDDLFNQLPIIFFGINNKENALMYSNDPLVTGVVEVVSMYETIEIALELSPNVENIIAISDNTPTGMTDLSTFYDEEELFPDVTFSDISMSEMTMEEMLIELTYIEDDSVFLLIAALRDVNDNVFDFDYSLNLITQNTDLPIYHLYEHGVGDGLFGGKVVSHYVQGESAAKMAIEYFEGTPISDIDLMNTSPNVYMFDYQLLDKYGLTESDFPEDTMFVNEDLSFFEEYRLYVYAGIIALIFIVLFIVFLLWTLHNRNKARKMAIQSKNHIEEVNIQLEEVNKQLKYSSYHDFLTTLYNRNFFEEEFPKIDEEANFPIGIILADVNGLKLLNDAFGHLIGDKALIETAKVLRKVFPNDFVARIGGDEFAIILKNTTAIEAYDAMNEVRESANAIIIEGMSLSLSLGYAMKETSDKTFNEMFTEAEDWMYREKLSQVPSNRSAMIETIIATINQKDVYSEIHSKRVAIISERIAQLMGMDGNVVSNIKTAGLLHDIGKIIVPSDILNKTGKLTSVEFAELKKHCEIGYRILNSVSSMRDIAEYVFCHHERVDGHGYPRGLKKDEIPMESRIISVADAVDAMLTDRLYREKLSREKCISELEEYKGTQFCTKVVDIVIEHFDELHQLIFKV